MPRPRAKTAARGYSGPHQALRERWRPHVDAGHATCHAAICLEERDGRGRRIRPGTPWHLGHNQARTAWTGPEHERCNCADGARRKNSRKPAISRAAWITSRAW